MLLPVCAGLCGCISGFLGAPLARSDFQPSDMLSDALMSAQYFTYFSVAPPFGFIMIPCFLLTVLWIQKKLKKLAGAADPHA